RRRALIAARAEETETELTDDLAVEVDAA
ncbi:MAG: hypothetical protein QOI43_787, partial [Gaiellales bacterium]|nr:hypothetical protein [Gaiellales bacterium]